MNNKEIIYVNGCSYAEGCDLGDHMYPFFEKYYSLNEINLEDIKTRERKQMSALDRRFKFLTNPVNNFLVRSIFQYQIDNRWSSQLADLLGRPVFNLSSQGASGMYAVAHRTMADLSSLQQQGYTISDVIIQVTGPRRYSFFGNAGDLNEPQRKFNNRYYHLKTGNYLNSGGLRPSLIEEIFYEETGEMANYRWLHEVYMLKHTVEAVTQARVILVDSAFYIKNIAGINTFNFTHASHWLTKNSQDYLIDFKKTLDEEIKLSMLTVIDDHDEPDTITNGMHVTEKVHRRFAEAIQETYFK